MIKLSIKSLLLCACVSVCYATVDDNLLLQDDSQQQTMLLVTKTKDDIAKIKTVSHQFLTTDNKLVDVINHPAFQVGDKQIGRLLLPINPRENNVDLNTSLKQLPKYMPFHQNVDPKTCVEALNALIEQYNHEQQFFFDLYSPSQLQQDESLKHTGLFFYKGAAHAPVAIIVSGGYSYSGLIHEGLPLAQKLAKLGINAFVLSYRLGNRKDAVADLNQAIAFIFEQQLALELDVRGYSVWGAAAGGNIGSYLGHHGVDATFNGLQIDKPLVQILEYPVGYLYQRDDPATYIVAGYDDSLGQNDMLKSVVNAMQEDGKQAQFVGYPKVSHGFGLGVGTKAENWQNNAIAFWNKVRNENLQVALDDKLQSFGN